MRGLYHTNATGIPVVYGGEDVKACFVHPSAYVALHRHAPEMWPSPIKATPDGAEALMADLAVRFQLKPAARPGTYQVGWVTRDQHPPRTISPEAAFYLQSNPDYQSGDGLMTIIPLDIRCLVKGSLSYLQYRLSRARQPTRSVQLGHQITIR